ncbi:MAG TPA: hypothetical protein VGT61_04880 [Thermomicrobiales bacterium]|nr:hypothetical protein [Thermomicrobiales bacterium]
MRDVDVVSHKLPGRGFVAACLDRRVMALADRGQASGAVGDRWAAMCADAVVGWGGAEQSAPGGTSPFVIDQVVRLDDVPAIAATASRRGMQNPDFLVVGQDDSTPVIQGLDAKFSAETAKSRQVSAEVVEDLLALRTLLEPLAGPIADNVVVLDGMFLCPDFPLTRLVFSGRAGIVRPAVRADQVMLIDAPADEFFDVVDGGQLIVPFADVDAIDVDPGESLLAALYYFRLVRAAAGIQSDERRPLLGDGERYVVDYDILAEALAARRRGAASAIEMIRQWDRDAESIRSQREAVEQVAGLPIVAHELRSRIEREALARGRVAPSVNKVRRRLGAWYRSELRELVGPIRPPVTDLGSILDRVGRAGRSLLPSLERETGVVVEALVLESALLEDVPLAPGDDRRPVGSPQNTRQGRR